MTEKEPAIDISPVAEPSGLLLLGRVKKPDAIVKSVAGWTKLPLPTGKELLRSIADDAVAEVVDLGQPVDAAMAASFGHGRFSPLYAYSVAVKSYDAAKTALGRSHRLVPLTNGQVKVLDMGLRGDAKPEKGEEEEGEDATTCILAHAPNGARLVCGGGAAPETLGPYLARTVASASWTSDLHLELRTEPLRLPLTQLPAIIGAFTGASNMPAARELLDTTFAELADVVGDAQRMQIDAQIADTGVVAATRVEFQSTKSTSAQLALKANATDAPAAFWHLPGEADSAFWANPSDPKLLDHARALLGNLITEAAAPSGLPDAERKTLRDLVADRTLSLFTNGGVYGKGYDAAGVDKALAARAKVKPNDVAADAEAKRIVVEQMVGWHLFQVNEPIAKTGPLLKDWSGLWNKPAFAKWAASMKSTIGDAPSMKVVALPAGVALPKESVHLEISVPREDIEDARPPVQPGKKPAPRKMIKRKPALFHVIAVPDGNATWLALGMDAKLAAAKAAASLASAPDATSLGKAARREALHEGKWTAAGFGTPRGFAVLSAAEGEQAYAALPGLPSKGDAPVFFTVKNEPPSAGVAAGASVSTFTIGRAAIEDIVKLGVAAK